MSCARLSSRSPSIVGGKHKSNLRSKRASSKLLHDRANYSNNVLAQVPSAAELAGMKLRKAELSLFFAAVQHPTPPARDNVDRVDYLLERYALGELGAALYKLYHRVPKGWESYLAPETQLKLRKLAAAERVANLDQGKLTHNLKVLMGEDTFVANDQVVKLQEIAQMQKAAGAAHTSHGPK